jgi:hypothetical protein
MPKATTNEQIDTLIAERGLRGMRFGVVRVERKARVPILWDDCPHGPKDVWVRNLKSGATTRCKSCSTSERLKARRLRMAEATLARALKEHHKGYTARLTEPRTFGTQGMKARRVAYTCPEGHEGEMALGNFAHGGHGCPTCADWGINLNAPGYLYVVRGGRWVKVGICNDERLEARLDEHNRQGLGEVLHTVYFDVTHDAKALEQLWIEQRSKIPAEFLPTKADIKNGFTEAAPAVGQVLRWIEQHLLPLATAA